MRTCVLLAVVFTGCSFQVAGISPPASSDPGPGTGAGKSPDDAAHPNPDPAPTPPDLAVAGPGPDMSSLLVGAACNNDVDCGGNGLTCAKSVLVGLVKVDLPGGYCTLDCHSGQPCPAGSYCGNFTFGDYCVSACPPDPCRTGYTCCAHDGAHACVATSLCSD